MKRTAMICLLLLAGMLAACSEKTEMPKTDGGASTTEEPQETVYSAEALPDADYEGYTFRILMRKGQKADQYLEQDSEDVVSSAVFRRNKAVEERLHCTITASESSDSNYDTDALNAILAGDDAYDLIFPHSRAAMAYAVQGALVDVNTIDAIDLDAPWWSKDLRDACEVNGKLYFLDGDISSSGLSNAMCLFFNKRLFDELGFDYPYDMVVAGDWTFDEFSYLVKKGGKDLNGDGVMDPAFDQYGLFDSDWFGPIEMPYTGGQRIYSRNEEGMLELSIYSTKTVEIFERYFNLTSNENCFLRLSGISPYTGNLFREGRAMIGFSSLGMAAEYRNMEDDFGIIPWPKFGEEDKYAAIVNAFSHVAVIPITVPDKERTGAITNALAAYGSEMVIPAFYEVSLKTKYARDDESEAMIDLIKDSMVYDVGYISGGAFSSVGYTLARQPNHDFASYYAANEARGRETVTAFNDSFSDEKEQQIVSVIQ